MSLDIVCAAVADVLHVRLPSGSDNFLDLGGSSLTAVQVVARIERITRVRIEPRDVFTSETLAEVADQLAAAVAAAASSQPLTPTATGVREDRSPRDHSRASLAQQWALDAARREPLAPPLQFQVAYRVTGHLDTSILRDALSAIVSHHPALRVAFRRDTDLDVMVLEEPPEVLVVEPAPPSDIDRLERLTAFARAPFDPAAGIRFRVLVLQTAPEQQDLCLAFDHHIADGWSLRVVLEDLGTAYAQLLNRRPIALPEAGSYLDFAETEWSAAADRIERAADYWLTVLPESYLDLSLTLPGYIAGPLTDPRHQAVSLPSHAVDALETLRAATGRSAFAVATAAVARAVADVSNRREVRILTSAANRDHTGHERTVGWFANGIYPTYAVSDHGSTAELVGHVAETVTRASEVGDVPAAYVRTRIWPDAPTGFRRDTGIYFACNDSWSEPLELAGCRLIPTEVEDRADGPGLQLYLLRDPGGWTLHTYFHADEYAPWAAKELSELFIQTLIRQAGEVARVSTAIGTKEAQ